MADTTPSLDQRIIRTSPILWLLGGLFSLLLIALGTQGLSDVADLFKEPALAEFLTPLVEPLNAELSQINERPDPRAAEIAAADGDAAALQQTTERAEESWRRWLETRATLGGSKGEDREIRERRDQIDELRKERDDANAKLSLLRSQPDPREAARQDVQRRIAAAQHHAEEQFHAAELVWRWRVLAARLALIVPVLLLAIALWRRRAASRYVTLLWGYWAFALWMVLWGIGPYLPHYGGYAPLALGIAVTMWGAMSLARWFNARAPLRRRRIVDTAIARHRCPSCDRDYLLGRETSVDAGLARKARTLHYDREALHPRACASCGLALFAPCPACQSLQLVHTEHCSSCGAARGATSPAR